MFRLMLDEHSRLHVPPESWFLTNLMDALPLADALTESQVQVAGNIISAHERWRDWGIEDQRLWEALSSLVAPTLGELADAVFRLSSGAKPRWGDKTPRYVTDITRLHEVFPSAKFIHLIRDGRDVCLSLKATKWWGSDAVSIGRYWSEQVDLGRRQGQALPQGLYHEVGYEDLVRSPEPVLRATCAFLGEEFQPGMLKFYEHAGSRIPERIRQHHEKTQRPPRPSDLGRWRRELRPSEVLLFEAVAGHTMRRVGQQLRYGGVAGIVGALLRLVDWGASVTRPIRRVLRGSFAWTRKLASGKRAGATR